VVVDLGLVVVGEELTPTEETKQGEERCSYHWPGHGTGSRATQPQDPMARLERGAHWAHRRVLRQRHARSPMKVYRERRVRPQQGEAGTRDGEFDEARDA